MSESFIWKNIEWQCSMEGGRIMDKKHPYYRYSPNCVHIDASDNLLLTSNYNVKDVKYHDGKVYKTDYEVGLVRSVAAFGYGFFTAVIKLPRGRLLWPSFWLLGEDRWPDNGEIDICEAWSNEKGSYFRPTIPQFPYLVPSWKTTNNVHWKEGIHKSTGTRNVPWLKQRRDPSEEFVEYQVEWRPNRIVFRVNGKVIRDYGWDVARNLLSRRMYVVANVWPDSQDFTQESPMVIRNFQFDSL